MSAKAPRLRRPAPSRARCSTRPTRTSCLPPTRQRARWYSHSRGRACDDARPGTAGGPPAGTVLAPQRAGEPPAVPAVRGLAPRTAQLARAAHTDQLAVERAHELHALAAPVEAGGYGPGIGEPGQLDRGRSAAERRAVARHVVRIDLDDGQTGKGTRVLPADAVEIQEIAEHVRLR